MLGLAALMPLGARSGAAFALANCSVDDMSIDAAEAEFLAIINDYRARAGVGALELSPDLTRSAAWMAADMGAKGYFGHTDSLGRNPWSRMADCGYVRVGGENLAAGPSRDQAAAAFELFRNSPRHNANMVDRDFRQVGIARVYTAGSTYGWYWATTFGYGPEASSPPVPPARPAPIPEPVAAPSKVAQPEPPEVEVAVEYEAASQDEAPQELAPAPEVPDLALYAAPAQGVPELPLTVIVEIAAQVQRSTLALGRSIQMAPADAQAKQSRTEGWAAAAPRKLARSFTRLASLNREGLVTIAGGD